jgi:hypothetical protein
VIFPGKASGEAQKTVQDAYNEGDDFHLLTLIANGVTRQASDIAGINGVNHEEATHDSPRLTGCLSSSALREW